MAKTPRFSRTEDFTALFSDDDRQDYILGILFIPAFTLVLMLLWFLVLAVLKCCAPNSFLGGRKVEEGCIRRILFLIPAVLAIVTFILFMTSGQNAFDVFVDDLHRDVKDVFASANEGLENIDSFANVAMAVKNLTHVLSLDLNDNFECSDLPDIPDEVLDELINFNNKFLDLDLDNAVEELTTFKGDLIEKFEGYEENNHDAIELMSDIFRTLVLVYAIPVICVVSIFIIMVFFSWSGSRSKMTGMKSRIYTAVQACFLMPTFMLVVILSSCLIAFIGTSLLVTRGKSSRTNTCIIVVCSSLTRSMSLTLSFSAISVDICEGGGTHSPEGSIEELLNDIESPGALTTYVNYYIISGCRDDEPTAFLNLPNIQNVINENLSFMNKTVTEFASIDARNCFEVIELGDALQDLIGKVGELNDHIGDTINLLDCEGINGLFVAVTHDLICDDVSTSMYWSFCTLYNLLICGLVMITFRAAIY